MRLVDSRQLENVRLALGITSTSVPEFDEDTLQQVLDVSRMLPGLGLGWGYVTARLNMAHAVTGNIYNTLDPYAIVEFLGGGRSTHWIWATAVSLQAEIVSGNAITREFAAVEYPVTPGTFPNGEAFLLAQTGAFMALGREVTAGAFAYGAGYAPAIPMPFFMPPGSIVQVGSSSTVAAGTIDGRVEFQFWTGPLGLTPPTA